MSIYKKPIFKRKWTPRDKRRMLHAGILAAVGGLYILIITLVQPFYTFNLWFSDQFLTSTKFSPNIVVAGIDDTTLANFGKWSDWPRSLHAQAVNNLEAAGASVISFDVIFADSSNDDQTFATSLRNGGNVILAGAGTTPEATKNAAKTYQSFLLPTPVLDQACSSVGHVNIFPDPDGKVRQIPLIVKQVNGDTYPSLCLATLFTLFHQTLPDNYTITNGKLNILNRVIPADASYFMRLNYSVVNSKPTSISYGDIINNSFDPSLVKNKIVLIGMTGTGDSDQFLIPNSSIRIPGVYIHAAAIDTILRTQFLTLVPLNVTLLIMALLLLLCAVVLPLFGTWHWTDVLKGAGLVIALLFIYVITGSLMAGQGHIMNVLYPSLILIVLFVTNILYMVIREQNDKRFVKDLFGRYVSPEISREIVSVANEGGLKLGGEERAVTVLFADIRNFTHISEQMTPENVVGMLNTCLPVVIDAIVTNGGLVNKFAGDNIMGVWNAPQSKPGHAQLAIKAAFEAQSNLMKLAETNPAMKEIQFGMGINTGKALAGNVGSLGRVEYTVIGDEVNLASRICSGTPGGEIYVGPETHNQTEHYFSFERLEPQLFKGKTEPIPIYRVIGFLPLSPA